MSKRMSDIGLATVMLFAGLVLSACGGGGSSGSGGSSDDDGTLKPGLYKTTIKYTDGKPTQEGLTSYLSPSGKFTIDFGALGVSIGTLSFDGTNISGTSNDYRLTDPNDRDAVPPEPAGFFEFKGAEAGTIAGSITSQGSATFTTSDTDGEVNTEVTLERQDYLSDLGLSLERASGMYEMGENEVNLNVDPEGSVVADYYSATTGCNLVGAESESLSVPDTSVNIFEITFQMACNDERHSGEYSGVGFVGPEGDPKMIFGAHNGTVAMRFSGTRQ